MVDIGKVYIDDRLAVKEYMNDRHWVESGGEMHLDMPNYDLSRNPASETAMRTTAELSGGQGLRIEKLGREGTRIAATPYTYGRMKGYVNSLEFVAGPFAAPDHATAEQDQSFVKDIIGRASWTKYEDGKTRTIAGQLLTEHQAQAFIGAAQSLTYGKAQVEVENVQGKHYITIDSKSFDTMREHYYGRDIKSSLPAQQKSAMPASMQGLGLGDDVLASLAGIRKTAGSVGLGGGHDINLEVLSQLSSAGVTKAPENPVAPPQQGQKPQKEYPFDLTRGDTRRT